ncbi:hypothetical protein GCM10027294_43620 [Marinactinospora endophytica]
MSVLTTRPTSDPTAPYWEPTRPEDPAMTTPAPPAPTPTPAARLDELEQQAANDITAIVARIAATGITGAALTAAAAAITAAILAPATAALAVGIALAASGGRGRRPLREHPLPTPVDIDVAVLLADAAARVDAAEDRRAELERVRARLVRLAITKIHQAASSGTAMYARAAGLGLRWVTLRVGACATCLALDGRTVGVGAVFAAPRGPHIPARQWDGFRGLPPVHPNCRCRIIPTRAARRQQ